MIHEKFIYSPPAGIPEILYHDTQIVVTHKISGLLSVPGRDPANADCLVSRIQKDFPSATAVHRLDMDTSGIMVLALTPESCRNLGMQFENRNVQKTYTAQVWGTIKEETGRVDLPIAKDWDNRPLQRIDPENGKPSQTDWRVIARESTTQENDTTRIALTPVTGRSHQLRIHMKALGHPILGDTFYAHDAAQKAADRLMLHAETLTFDHPTDKNRISFTASCPF